MKYSELIQLQDVCGWAQRMKRCIILYGGAGEKELTPLIRSGREYLKAFSEREEFL